MAELIRITTYPGTRTVCRSSITGKFVSKSYCLDNPDTTYKTSVRTPKCEWVDPEKLFQGFRLIQFHDSTDTSWFISLQQPIRVTKLSAVCDQLGVPLNWIVETIYHLPYWRDSLQVDVHEFKKQ